MGEAGDSLEDITKKEGFAVRGVAEKRKETKFGEGGKGDRRHINADRFRRGKNGTEVIIDNVDGGHEGVGGDNGGYPGGYYVVPVRYYAV